MSLGMKLSGWFQRRKDASASMVIEKVLQSQVAPYGRMIHFDIDTKAKTARIELLLKGETHPLIITVKHYDLVTDDHGTHVVVTDLETNREWVGALLNTFLRGKRFQVPPQYVKWLNLLG